jgi:hypothetical protein
MTTIRNNLTFNNYNNLKKTTDVGRIYIAEVMDTRTPLYNGDVLVWVLGSDLDKNNPNNWIIAHNANSMNGITIYTPETSKSTYNTQPTSFGWWNPLPYVGNYVFIFYPCTNGEKSNAYWFGTPMSNNNIMMPGTPYNILQNDEDYTPVCETNFTSSTISKPQEYPILKNALEKQGLNKDRLRGISTASAYRETPSMCYGFLSPLGNQFVIDDGWSNGDSNVNWNIDPRTNAKDQNNKDDNGKNHSKKDWKANLDDASTNDKLNRFHGGFRFRTRNGTQLLILDTGNIYMINKDGSAWMELSDDGYIDCYSERGINASSDGDINLYSKSNVNIEAKGRISMKSGGGISLDTNGAINTQCGGLNVSSQISVPTIMSEIANVGLLTSKNAQLNGTFQGTLNGTAQFATLAGTTPIQQPIPIINQVKLSPVVVTQTQEVVQMVDGNTEETIATRVPSHEPYAGHDKNKFIPKMISRLFRKLKKEDNTNKETITKSNTISR